MKKPLIGVVAATALCALGAAATASAQTDVQQAQSGNWSGYVASAPQAGGFHDVSGSWVVPSASCTAAGASTYSAFWVGLGGAGQSDALEQAGTETNCTSTGQVSQYAWYELVPQAPVRIDMPVAAGDHIQTKVTVDGSTVSISLVDQTTEQSFEKNIQMSDPDVSSAEWIAEAPSQCEGGAASDCTPLPLTNFGKVSFSSASATDTSGHTGTISDSSWTPTAVTLSPDAGAGYQGVDLGSGAGSGGAEPSSLSADGSSFTASYTTGGGSQRVGGSGGSGGSGGYGGYGGGGYGYGGGGYGYGGGGYGGYSGGYGYGGGGYGYAGGGYGSGGGGYGYGNGGDGDGGGGYGDGGWTVVVPGAGWSGDNGWGGDGGWYSYAPLHP